MGAILEDRKIEIDQKSLKNIDIARQWAMFLAVLGFIFLGLMIVMGALAGTFLSAFSIGETESGFPEYFMLIIYVVLALAYFFPVFYLFRFSKYTARAVKTLNKKELNKAIKNLKLYFVHIGILVIIILSLYIGILILAGSSISLLKGI